MQFKKDGFGTRQAEDAPHNLFYSHISSPASSRTGSVVPKKQTEEEKKEEKQKISCKHKSLTIECSHEGERGFKLALPLPANSKSSNIFQVVAGAKKGDIILAKTQILEGPCEKHKNKVLAVQGAKPESISDTEVKFPVLCDPKYALGSTVPEKTETQEKIAEQKQEGEWVKQEEESAASGMYAVVYKHSVTEEVVLAFRGTEATSIKDWVADIQNHITLELPQQYKDALEFAKKMKAKYGDGLVVTGHSLGGGLTQYVCLNLNLKGFTFNPAELGIGAQVSSIFGKLKSTQKDIESDVVSLIDKAKSTGKDVKSDLSSLFEKSKSTVEGIGKELSAVFQKSKSAVQDIESDISALAKKCKSTGQSLESEVISLLEKSKSAVLEVESDVSALFEKSKSAVLGVESDIRAILEKSKNSALDIKKDVSSVLKKSRDAVEGMESGIASALEKSKATALDIKEDSTAVLKQSRDSIQDIKEDGVSFLKKSQGSIQGIQGDALSVLKKSKESVQDIKEDGASVLKKSKESVQHIKEDVSSVIEKSKASVLNIKEEASSVFEKSKSDLLGLKDQVSSVFEKSKSTVLGIEKEVRSVFEKWESTAQSIEKDLSSIFDKAKSSAMEIKDNATSLFEKTKSSVMDIKNDAFSILEKSKSTVMDIKDDVLSLFDKTKSSVMDIKNDVTSFVEKTKSSVLGVKDDVCSLVEKSKSAVLDAGSQISSLFKNWTDVPVKNYIHKKDIVNLANVLTPNTRAVGEKIFVDYPVKGSVDAHSIDNMVEYFKNEQMTEPAKYAMLASASYGKGVPDLGKAAPEKTAPEKAEPESDASFLKNFWIYPATSKRYKVSAESCNFAEKAYGNIEAFPDLQWEAKIKFCCGSITTMKVGEKKASISFSGSLKKTSEGLSASKDVKFSAAKIVGPLQKVQDIAEEILKAIGKLVKTGGMKSEFNITFPTVEIAGTWGYNEIKKSPKACHEFDISVGFSPLLGMSGQIDILDGVCAIYPPLLKIKQFLENTKGLSCQISLWLIAGGEISGKLKVKYSQEKFQPEGSLKGEVSLGIKAEIFGNADVFCVSAKAGGSIEGNTSVYQKLTTGMDNQGPYLKGDIGWEGLKITGVIYASVDVKLKIFETELKKEASLEKTILEPKKYEWMNVYLFKKE